MALVKCAKCGEMVAAEASSCPACGFIPDDLNNVAPDEKAGQGLLLQWIGVGLILAGGPLAMARSWDFVALIPVGIIICLYARYVK